MPRTVAAAGLAIAGFVGLGLLLRLLPPALASGDAAVTEIFVLHVTRCAWGLGPYSQFYWNHPGPLMFQLLAPLYVLSGQHAQALNAGATIVNLAAVAALLRIVARAGEPVGTVAVSSALCVWLLRAPDTLSSFWNPVLIALPAMLFVWICALAAAGGPHALVGVVAVGSFLVQSHVGLVPPVACCRSQPPPSVGVAPPAKAAPRDRPGCGRQHSRQQQAAHSGPCRCINSCRPRRATSPCWLASSPTRRVATGR